MCRLTVLQVARLIDSLRPINSQASAAFKAINTQLGALPADSPEKAEIIAECGLHLLLEARRCKVENQAEDARTKAQRAADCLETSIKCTFSRVCSRFPCVEHVLRLHHHHQRSATDSKELCDRTSSDHSLTPSTAYPSCQTAPLPLAWLDPRVLEQETRSPQSIC